MALDELWGDAATRRLYDRLARARDTLEAAAILESAIAERLATTPERPANTPLVLAAAGRLTSANVNAVAAELGVSERHLRRVFRESVGRSSPSSRASSVPCAPRATTAAQAGPASPPRLATTTKRTSSPSSAPSRA